MASSGNAVPNPLQTRGNNPDILSEMDAAETNINSILAVARDLAARSLLAQYSKFDIRPLEKLVAFLKLIFALIRRRCFQSNPNIDLGGRYVARENESLPNLAGVSFECLCPLTVFLRIIASSLSQVRLRVGPATWGSVDPLRRKLESLQARLERFPSSGKGRPGLARCIMFHEEHGVFTVTATSPAYKRLSGLDLFSKWIRYRQINQLKEKVGPQTRKHIEEKLKYSEQIIDTYNVPGNQNDQDWELSFNQSEAIQVDGTGATFDTFGAYKIACVVDYCRFSMNRTQPGNTREREATPQARGANGAEACAEWELWLMRLAEGPAQPLPTRVYLPYKPGMPHSNTFPTIAQPSTPAAYRHTARMTDVPNLTPFNSKPPPARHQNVKKAHTWDHPIHPIMPHLLNQRPAKKSQSRYFCCC